MTNTVQPPDIRVPKNEPFKYDLLGREGQAIILTSALRIVEGPCTVSLDAPWGDGKTTFIRMWAQYLKNEEFRVVSFNAWDNDFSDNPFLALSEELLAELQKHLPSNTWRKLRRSGFGVLRHATPKLLSWGAKASGIPLLSSSVDFVLGLLNAQGQKSPYQKSKDSMVAFKSQLRDAARTTSGRRNELPLVIFVDELDRCRPSYAIELLEITKHLFAVDGLIVIFSVNRTQLAHSIRSVYGEKFDAEDYLHRFFNLNYRLPPTNHRSFVESQILESGLFDSSHLKSDNVRDRYESKAEIAKVIMINLFSGQHPSRRSIVQAIQHFSLIRSMTIEETSVDPDLIALALAIRTLDADLYARFLQGKATAEELMDELLLLADASLRRDDHSVMEIEATLIAVEMSKAGMSEPSLLEHYKRIQANSPEIYDSHEVNVATDMLLRVSDRLSATNVGQRFQEVTEMIELSSQLLSDTKT